MTSEERKEGRYQRRCARREAKRRARSEACGSFEQVFSYENLYKAGLACCKGVRWKCSTQRYDRAYDVAVGARGQMSKQQWSDVAKRIYEVSGIKIDDSVKYK